MWFLLDFFFFFPIFFVYLFVSLFDAQISLTRLRSRLCRPPYEPSPTLDLPMLASLSSNSLSLSHLNCMFLFPRPLCHKLISMSIPTPALPCDSTFISSAHPVVVFLSSLVLFSNSLSVDLKILCSLVKIQPIARYPISHFPE